MVNLNEFDEPLFAELWMAKLNNFDADNAQQIIVTQIEWFIRNLQGVHSHFLVYVMSININIGKLQFNWLIWMLFAYSLLKSSPDRVVCEMWNVRVSELLMLSWPHNEEK